MPKLPTEHWLDKWDSKIMWWFYDILENELDITMIHDSTKLREMLEEAKSEALESQRQAIRSEVEGSMGTSVYSEIAGNYESIRNEVLEEVLSLPSLKEK